MLWWLPSFIAGSITVLITLFIITATGPPIGSTSSIAMDLQNFSIKGGLYANIEIDAQPPNPIFGCNRYAHFFIYFAAPPTFSEADWAKLQAESKNIRLALMLVFPHVYGFQQDKLNANGSKFPPIQENEVQFTNGDGLTLIRSNDPVEAESLDQRYRLGCQLLCRCYFPRRIWLLLGPASFPNRAERL
jgi:hypothetical protein